MAGPHRIYKEVVLELIAPPDKNRPDEAMTASPLFAQRLLPA